MSNQDSKNHLIKYFSLFLLQKRDVKNRDTIYTLFYPMGELSGNASSGWRSPCPSSRESLWGMDTKPIFVPKSPSKKRLAYSLDFPSYSARVAVISSEARNLIPATAAEDFSVAALRRNDRECGAAQGLSTYATGFVALYELTRRFRGLRDEWLPVPMTEPEKHLVKILELVQIEKHVPVSAGRQWLGRPVKEREAIVRAFVAKAVLRCQHTCTLRHT